MHYVQNCTEIWSLVYGPDGDGGDDSGSAGAGDSGDGGGDGGASGGGGDGSSGGPSGSRLFTDEQQRRVDEVVQTRLARDKKKSEEIISQLESLKTSAKLTSEERDNLQKQINSMETANMTEKELAAKARKTENAKATKVLDTVTGERDMWKTRFEDSTIRREIVDAASRKDTKAYNATQIVSQLLEETKLVETTEDGKPTGTFVARVKFNGRDTENKPIVMDLSVPEALDEMVKMPEHSNLFESGLVDGLGGNTIPGTGPLGSVSHSTQEEYRKNRKKIKSET